MRARAGGERRTARTGRGLCCVLAAALMLCGLAPRMAPARAGWTPMTVLEAANLRTAPRVDAPRRYVLYPGHRLLARPEGEHWLAVATPGEGGAEPLHEGYVHASLLAAATPGAAPEAAKKPREEPTPGGGPGLAGALGLTVTPRIEARTGWDSNILYKGVSGWEWYLAPSIEVVKETERGSLSLTAGIGNYAYTDNGEYDHLDQDYQTEMAYRLSPRLALDLGGRLRVQNAFVSSLEESGTVVERGRQTKASVGGGLDWRPGDRDDLRLDADYEAARNGMQPENDRGVVTAQAQWRRDLDRTLALLVRAGAGRHEYATGWQGVYRTLAGASWDAGETLTLTALAGGALSTPRFEGRREDELARDRAFAGEMSLAWKRERDRFVLSGDVGPSSGSVENVLRKAARVRYERDLDELLTAQLGMSLVASSAPGYVSAKRSRALGTTARLNWRLAEHSLVYAGWERMLTKDMDTDAQTERNWFFLGFSREFQTR